MLKDGDKKPGVHRGRYNMDFDPVKGDPYGNMQKAREHIDALKNREREAKEQESRPYVKTMDRQLTLWDIV